MYAECMILNYHKSIVGGRTIYASAAYILNYMFTKFSLDFQIYYMLFCNYNNSI